MKILKRLTLLFAALLQISLLACHANTPYAPNSTIDSNVIDSSNILEQSIHNLKEATSFTYEISQNVLIQFDVQDSVKSSTLSSHLKTELQTQPLYIHATTVNTHDPGEVSSTDYYLIETEDGYFLYTQLEDGRFERQAIDLAQLEALQGINRNFAKELAGVLETLQEIEIAENNEGPSLTMTAQMPADAVFDLLLLSGTNFISESLYLVLSEDLNTFFDTANTYVPVVLEVDIESKTIDTLALDLAELLGQLPSNIMSMADASFVVSFSGYNAMTDTPLPAVETP